MSALRILVVAGALAAGAVAASGDADASPVAAIRLPGVAMETAQAFCGPHRCFARPFWRYRSGAGFRPYRRFGYAPRRLRFAPFGFGRFGGFR